MYYEMKYDSPVGRLTLASDGLNLAGLWMEGQKYFAAAKRGAGSIFQGKGLARPVF